jgi:hypothetical protein
LGQLKVAEAGWRIATESKYAYDRRPHFGKLEKALDAAVRRTKHDRDQHELMIGERV